MSAEARTIPEDIHATVEDIFENDWMRPFRNDEAKTVVAEAILAERKRCASIARDATMMTGAPVEEIGDGVAAAVRSQPKASKFWMVYGIGQRGPTYQHSSKALAQLEAQRLASLHPEIMFVVLAAVDAYRTDTPAMQRIKIIKPDPADHTVADDGIPF